MSSDCCDLTALHQRQTSVLRIVLLINLVMFFVEMISGIKAQSSSLLADSLDMLGDSVAYGMTLWVIHRGERWRAIVAAMKGAGMLGFGLIVLVETFLKLGSETVPDPKTIGAVGALALVANLTCAFLLMRHRKDDINMKSTWRCTRNDVMANMGVLLAGFAVSVTQSRWPDIAVGATIASVVIYSAMVTLREGVAKVRQSKT